MTSPCSELDLVTDWRLVHNQCEDSKRYVFVTETGTKCGGKKAEVSKLLNVRKSVCTVLWKALCFPILVTFESLEDRYPVVSPCPRTSSSCHFWQIAASLPGPAEQSAESVLFVLRWLLSSRCPRPARSLRTWRRRFFFWKEIHEGKTNWLPSKLFLELISVLVKECKSPFHMVLTGVPNEALILCHL